MRTHTYNLYLHMAPYRKTPQQTSGFLPTAPCNMQRKRLQQKFNSEEGKLLCNAKEDIRQSFCAVYLPGLNIRQVYVCTLLVLSLCSIPDAECWCPTSVPVAKGVVNMPSKIVEIHRNLCKLYTRRKVVPILQMEIVPGSGTSIHSVRYSHFNAVLNQKLDRRCLLGQAAVLAAVPEIVGAVTPVAENPTNTVFSTFGRPADGTKRIFFCRHGQTEYNRLKLMQGRRVDAPINDNGMMQAELLGKAMADQDLKLVASSSLLRAKQTADAVKQQQRNQDVARLVLKELDEIDFGEVDGMEVQKARATMGGVYAQVNDHTDDSGFEFLS